MHRSRRMNTRVDDTRRDGRSHDEHQRSENRDENRDAGDRREQYRGGRRMRHEHIHHTHHERGGGRHRDDHVGDGDGDGDGRDARGGRGEREFRGRHGGGRHRARRGAVLDAILILLDERPMHGYEIITELDSRSEGRWRPSPGAVYPALNRMEEEGLVESTDVDGKNEFSLTAAGRTRLGEYSASRGDDAVEPWNETGSGRRGDLRGHMSELVGQVRQIGRFGTPEQLARAGAVLDTAKRDLYMILAQPPSADDAIQDTVDPSTATESAGDD